MLGLLLPMLHQPINQSSSCYTAIGCSDDKAAELFQQTSFRLQ